MRGKTKSAKGVVSRSATPNVKVACSYYKIICSISYINKNTSNEYYFDSSKFLYQYSHNFP
eukprot:SAG11_NODE_329_length_10681_cov_7.861274_10_plen_61_part_00